VSALQLDEVLAKIRKNAQVAVGGKEFALLVEEDNEMHCRSSSTLPRESVVALEQWAQGGIGMRDGPMVFDDLQNVPALAALPRDRALPLRSLCSVPLMFRGRSLGLLVALANSEGGFLPHDVELLQSYAAQAAIALENARLYEAQQALASRDPLTGLLNHREFHEAVARELEECRRHGGSMSVVLLDLDDFKRVNDSHGHPAGDRMIAEIAEVLRQRTRESDTLARLGGDEFAIVLPRCSLVEARMVAESIADAIRRRQPARGDVDPITASIGVAMFGDDPRTSSESVVSEADTAMYAAKDGGRDGVRVFDPIAVRDDTVDRTKPS
jgi:diguanylate cyclase (GGDEF)-like protein